MSKTLLPKSTKEKAIPSLKKKNSSKINNNYIEWSKEELIKELERIKKRKKYGLVWENKLEDVVERCKKELPVLEEVKGREIITVPDKPMNLLIEGDNYHALSVLNYTHKGKIDVIYIDPPYNTGKKDFVYNDHYVDSEDGFKHSKWLSFIEKRLRLAKQLLKKTGIIITHIDENEESNLHLLLTEIFGELNDLGKIIWNKKNPKGDSKGVSIMHESVLCFAKNRNEFLKSKNVLKRKKPNFETMLRKANSLFNKMGNTIIPDEIKEVIKPFDYSKEILNDFKVTYNLDLANKEFQNWLSKQAFSGGEKAYKYIDEKGSVYRGVSMAWPNKKEAPEEYFTPLVHPITKKECPVPERGWRYSKKTMANLIKEGKIIFGENEKKQPERKYLLKENIFQNTPSIFADASSDDELLKEIGITFDYPKPYVVSKYLLSAIHPNPKIVLDFMAGSGTTAHAILELNKEDDSDRRFILCTNNELNSIGKNLSKKTPDLGEEQFGLCQRACYPRIKKVIDGYVLKNGNGVNGLGGNLKYFKTTFVPADPTDKNKITLTKKATEMLCVKEDTFEKLKSNNKYKIYRNKNRYTGIIFDHMAINNFKKDIAKIDGEFSVYVFSLGDDTFAEEFEDIKSKVKLSPIPEAILRVYRRIFK